jgi:hypothetical protein
MMISGEFSVNSEIYKGWFHSLYSEVLSYKNETIDTIESSHRDIKVELESLRNAVSNAMYNKLLADQDEREYLAEMAARKMLELQHREVKLIKHGGSHRHA